MMSNMKIHLYLDIMMCICHRQPTLLLFQKGGNGKAHLPSYKLNLKIEQRRSSHPSGLHKTITLKKYISLENFSQHEQQQTSEQ